MKQSSHERSQYNLNARGKRVRLGLVALASFGLGVGAAKEGPSALHATIGTVRSYEKAMGNQGPSQQQLAHDAQEIVNVDRNESSAVFANAIVAVVDPNISPGYTESNAVVGYVENETGPTLSEGEIVRVPIVGSEPDSKNRSSVLAGEPRHLNG